MKRMLVLMLMAVSGSAMAHPGHDHTHWLSDALHLMLVGGSVGVFIAGCLWMRKSSSQAQKRTKH